MEVISFDENSIYAAAIHQSLSRHNYMKRPAPSDEEDRPETEAKKTSASPYSITTNETSKSTQSAQSLTSNSNSNRYSQTNQGPFFIHLQSNASPPASVHPLMVGRALNQAGKKDVLEIKKIGFSKISVKFRTREAANNMVDSQLLSDKNITAFIPNFRISRQGIIRNIPLDLNIEEITEGFDKSFNIISIKRLNRRITGKNEKGENITNYAPSKTILVTFQDQILLKYAFIYSVRHEIVPFTPRVSICFFCLRFGHVAVQCRSKPRCKHCAKFDHSNESECPDSSKLPTCANCKGAHKSTDKNCPAFHKQKEVLSLAASENISLIEAREKINLNHGTPTNSTTDFINYPYILKSSSHSWTDMHSPKTPSISPISYAKVASRLANSQASASVHTLDSQYKNPPPSPISLSRNPRNTHNLPPLETKGGRPLHTHQRLDRAPKELFIAPNGRTPLFASPGCGLSPQPSQEQTPPANNLQDSTLTQLVLQIITFLINSNPSLLNSINNDLFTLATPGNAHSTNKSNHEQVSETWLTKDTLFDIPFRKIIRKDSDKAKSSGLCFVIKEDIPFQVINSVTNIKGNLDTLTIRIDTPKGFLTIVSLYRHPSAHTTSEHWTKLFSSIPSSDGVVVAGDFNSNNPLWGSSVSNSSGNSLASSLDSFDPMILNDGSQTRINGPGQNISAIDLTLVSSNLFPFCMWKTLNDNMNSDHYPISCTIQHPICTHSQFSHRLDSGNIDWKLYSYTLQKYYEQFSVETDGIQMHPLDKYDRFVEHLKKALLSAGVKNNNSHRGRSKRNPPSAPWWNDECTIAVEERKKALRLFRQVPNHENYIQLRKCEAMTKKILKRNKRRGWREYCEQLNPATKPSQVWRMVKKF